MDRLDRLDRLFKIYARIKEGCSLCFYYHYSKELDLMNEGEL